MVDEQTLNISHHMDSWPKVHRLDGRIERVCVHGVGHPDPEYYANRLRLDPENAWADGVHGCDGCCHEEVTNAS